LQEIVINQLKRKAGKKKSSTAFLDDLQTREKAWAAAGKIRHSADGERSQMINEEYSSESADDDQSVNLSDIKSENESIYWQE